MTRDKVLDVVCGLKLKDRISINNWENEMQVVGISERFVLAHDGQEYTIISKQPTDCTYNSVMAGDIVCAPDDWVLGYGGGYHFDDPAWVEEYMKSLESLQIKSQAPRWRKFAAGRSARKAQQKGHHQRTVAERKE